VDEAAIVRGGGGGGLGRSVGDGRWGLNRLSMAPFLTRCVQVWPRMPPVTRNL